MWYLRVSCRSSCSLASYSSSFGGLYGVLVQASVLITSLCGSCRVVVERFTLLDLGLREPSTGTLRGNPWFRGAQLFS